MRLRSGLADVGVVGVGVTGSPTLSRSRALRLRHARHHTVHSRSLLDADKVAGSVALHRAAPARHAGPPTAHRPRPHGPRPTAFSPQARKAHAQAQAAAAAERVRHTHHRRLQLRALPAPASLRTRNRQGARAPVSDTAYGARRTACLGLNRAGVPDPGRSAAAAAEALFPLQPPPHHVSSSPLRSVLPRESHVAQLWSAEAKIPNQSPCCHRAVEARIRTSRNLRRLPSGFCPRFRPFGARRLPTARPCRLPKPRHCPRKAFPSRLQSSASVPFTAAGV